MQADESHAICSLPFDTRYRRLIVTVRMNATSQRVADPLTSGTSGCSVSERALPKVCNSESKCCFQLVSHCLPRNGSSLGRFAVAAQSKSRIVIEISKSADVRSNLTKQQINVNRKKNKICCSRGSKASLASNKEVSQFPFNFISLDEFPPSSALASRARQRALACKSTMENTLNVYSTENHG